MTNKETIERNIGLTFDFVHYLIDNPSAIERLDERFKLEFLEKDFGKTEKNQVMRRKSKVNKKFVRVKNTFELAK